MKEITELNELISSLFNEINSLDSIMDLSEIIFQIIDCDNKIIFVNKTGLELLGYSKEEMIGKGIAQFILNEDEDVFNIKRNNTDFETSFLTKSGEKRIINWHCKEEKDEKGNKLYTLCSC